MNIHKMPESAKQPGTRAEIAPPRVCLAFSAFEVIHRLRSLLGRLRRELGRIVRRRERGDLQRNESAAFDQSLAGTKGAPDDATGFFFHAVHERSESRMWAKLRDVSRLLDSPFQVVGVIQNN